MTNISLSSVGEYRASCLLGYLGLMILENGCFEYFVFNIRFYFFFSFCFYFNDFDFFFKQILTVAVFTRKYCLPICIDKLENILKLRMSMALKHIDLIEAY